MAGLRKIFLLLALLLPLISPGQDAHNTVQFIVTGDLHGRMKNFSRLAAQIRKYPRAIKIDLGDIFQGDPVHDSSCGRFMVDALNELKYDIFIPGNHDFEIASDEFIRTFSRFSGTLLGQWRCGKLPVRQWQIIERGGVKCAIIGMTDHGLYKKRLFYPGYSFVSELAALDAALKEISRHLVDVVILARHGGDYFPGMHVGKVLWARPEIELMFCAHTHREIPGRRSGRCLIVQPAPHGRSAVLVTVKKGAARGNIITSQLICPDDKMADDRIDALHKQASREMQPTLKKACATVRKRAEFVSAGLRRMCAVSGCDVAVIDLPYWLKPGEYSVYDWLKTFTYRNRLCVVKVSAADFKTFLKERPPRGFFRYHTPLPAGRNQLKAAVSSFQLSRSRVLQKYTEVKVTSHVVRSVIAGKNGL